MVVATTKASQTPQTAKIPPSNEDGLLTLEKKKNLSSFVFLMTSAGALGLTIAGCLPMALLLGVSHASIRTTAKCARLFKVLDKLLKDEFLSGRGMEAFPILAMEETTEHSYVDLYIRFPGRTQIFIATRSAGKNTIVYHEARESLRVKRVKRSNFDIKPCPLMGLNESKRWLEKNRQMFGLSSRQVLKTPTAKVLVVSGQTQIAPHRDELYTEIGSREYLTLFKRGTKTFVVMEDDLAEFIRDWLTHLDGQKR